MIKGGFLMKKAVWTLGVLFLAAALLTLPGPAQAEMYIEAYLGASLPDTFDTAGDIAGWAGPTDHDRGTFPGKGDAAVIGGLKVGTWFVPTGFLGYSYPDWMKYFGFYTDFSFHRLDARNSQYLDTFSTGNVVNGTGFNDFKSEGTVATWAFMFAARYGFFPDSDVPFGRLQPYVAVGPAVMFSTQQPRFGTYTPFTPGSASSTDIALAVDAGLRYMCLKNVSVDLSFKYRYAQPSYSYSAFNPTTGFVNTLEYNPTYNLFSVQLGAAYHF
jgi:opacity protein-like surface antigen